MFFQTETGRTEPNVRYFFHFSHSLCLRISSIRFLFYREYIYACMSMSIFIKNENFKCFFSSPPRRSFSIFFSSRFSTRKEVENWCNAIIRLEYSSAAVGKCRSSVCYSYSTLTCRLRHKASHNIPLLLRVFLSATTLFLTYSHNRISENNVNIFYLFLPTYTWVQIFIHSIGERVCTLVYASSYSFSYADSKIFRNPVVTFDRFGEIYIHKHT